MVETEKIWQEMYATLAPKMLGVCRRYVNDIALAEDLMHDAFIKAIEKSETYKGSGSFAAWLHRVTVNTALMHLRENKRFSTSSFHDQVEHIPEGEIENDRSEIGVREIIENAEFSQAELLEMLDELPDQHRAVFNLYVIDGYTHFQIGEMLGISSGTSKSHLARARKKLQAILLKRAHGMEQRKKERKRRAIFYLPVFGGSKHFVDTIFADGFSDFSINPSGSFDVTTLKSGFSAQPQSGVLFSVKSALIIGSVVGAAILSVLIYSNINMPSPNVITPIHLPMDSIHSRIAKPDSTFHVATDSAEAKADSSTRSVSNERTKKIPVIVKKQIVVKDTVYIYDDEKE
jgi:RNA polymerase sigma factor (sigma-70 family)